MVATALSNPYSIFMRKIGYSVGLEETLKRIGDLEKKYTETGDITLSSWNELVHGPKPENWDLKSENIADFFYTMRLIQCIHGDILVLENLDALAITNTLLSDSQQKKIAREFLMLWAILVNDGEIFVNLLLAGFKENLIKEKLSEMIMEKRIQANKNPSLNRKIGAAQINRIINIERQETNKGSAGLGQSVLSLQRTTPLQVEKLQGMAKAESEAIEFSEDYFRKVPPRRKDWARSLGLWEDKSGLTQKGNQFIKGLTEAGYINEKGLFIYWPMDYELVRAGLQPNLLGEQSKSLWDCLIDFGGAYSHLQVSPISTTDVDEVIELIGKMLNVFRNHHTRKVMLRREIPITVAYSAAVACACATQEPIFDLPAAIESIQKGDERRLAFRRSRTTGGALSLKR